MTTTPARKYNPGFLSDEELVASFCVRTHEFESLMEMLRDCTGNSNRHQIVIGPRGSGKTSLLLRIAAEVRRDPDLATGFFPVVFAEESYEVATAGEFWLECLARLANQAPPRDDAPDLHRTLADLRTIQDDQLLGERCLAAVLDFSEREGKRLVLMVENLNMMFRDMMDPDAGWRLRKILQTEPRIILLASATSRFDEIDQPDHALYELLRVITLRRLTTKECAVLWKTVSGQSRPTNTIRSLEILTGGSPRLLAIVARFGAGLSFRELMENLLDLVDDHTEYFKSHLESLPAQERRVYLALADLWKPALTKEIAERARLATSKCSAQLMRLVERGVVLVAGGSARRKQYYLSERMYNIYYLLRRGQSRLIEVLIRFMATYYSPHELKEIGTRIALEAEDAVPEIRSLYQYASARLLAISERALQLKQGRAWSSTGSAEDAQVIEAGVLLARGGAFWKRNQYQDVLATFDELLERFGETQVPELLVISAMAFVGRSAALIAMNRPEDGVADCDEVVRRFNDSEMPELLEQVASALVNKGSAFGVLGKLEEELATYEEVLRRFDGGKAQELFAPVVAALANKGAALSGLGRREEALAAYEEVEVRFRDSDALEVLERVAMALVNKGAVLSKLKRHSEALAAYDDVLRRFGESDSPRLLGQVSTALVRKVATLGGLSRFEEALPVCDEVLRRFGESDAPGLLAGVLTVLAKKVAVLIALNRLDEALATSDEVLDQFRESDAPESRVEVASVLINRVLALGKLDRPDEALAACDEVLHRFGESDALRLLELVAKAFLNKGVALRQLNRREEALAVYDEMIRRFAGSDTFELLGPVASVLVNKVRLFAELNHTVEVPDVETLLATLAKLGSIPRPALEALITTSVDLGPERMRALIEASAAHDLLSPLTAALERELGQEPRVPQEVSEVAEDIRRDLAKIREARSGRGADVLIDLQQDAVRRGLDQLSMDEIDEEIRAFRKGRKDG